MKAGSEDALAFQLNALRIPHERQFHFHATRRWRSDFRIGGLLVEVEGAIYGKPGRHQRIDGMDADCEKYAEALLAGYDLLRVTTRMVKDGRALAYIERYLAKEKPRLDAGAQ